MKADVMDKTRKTVEDRKQALIDDLIEARRHVLDAAQSLPADAAAEIFLGTWSVKELLAHLVGWDFTNLHAIQEIINGQYPTFFRYYDQDWHSYNQQLVEKYHKEALFELLTEAKDSHRQLIEFLRSCSAEDLVKGRVRRENGRSVTIRNLLTAEARDEGTHAEQVLAFKERLFGEMNRAC